MLLNTVTSTQQINIIFRHNTFLYHDVPNSKNFTRGLGKSRYDFLHFTIFLLSIFLFYFVSAHNYFIFCTRTGICHILQINYVDVDNVTNSLGSRDSAWSGTKGRYPLGNKTLSDANDFIQNSIMFLPSNMADITWWWLRRRITFEAGR